MSKEMGAQILGIVLSDLSPRKGSTELVREMKEYGMNVASVYTDIKSCVEMDSGEDFAQLHFDHNIETIEEIKRDGRKVISVIDVDRNVLNSTEMKERGRKSDLILLESREGIEKKISYISPFLNEKTGVSGKINAVNIGSIIEFRPGFVDVSSSLELCPGKKDMEKVREFFEVIQYGR